VLESLDEVLIEIVAGKDLSIGEASSVKKLASLDTEPGKITAVKTDTSKLVSALLELLAGLDGLTNTGQGVVGIDEKDAVVRSSLSPVVESNLLRGEALHPGVSVSASNRDAVALASKHVRSSGAATDESSTAGGESTVKALSTTETKLEHGLAEARGADTCGLCGDESAKVDHAQQGGLHELSLQDGTLDTHQGLEGEDNGTLGDGVDVEGKRAHVDQVLKEGRIEERLAIVALERGKVIGVGLGETERVEPLEGRLETGADGVTTVEGLGPEKHVEHSLSVSTATLPVALGHCQLVKISQEAQALHLVARHGRLRAELFL